MGIHLQYDERLWILRTGDHGRSWESLDDERFCILCEKTFIGRQIEITRHRDGEHELRCPTPGCNSKPHQWVYQGNPLTSDTVYEDCLRALGEEQEPVSIKTARLVERRDL
jgi:hypothetical protein